MIVRYESYDQYDKFQQIPFDAGVEHSLHLFMLSVYEIVFDIDDIEHDIVYDGLLNV
jgi:hypothetical protein